MTHPLEHHQGIRYFDIGVNFTDPMFHGSYHGKHHHHSDLEDVILRAKTFNVKKMLVTGSSLNECRTLLELVDRFPGLLYGTVGVHPCAVNEIKDYGEERYLAELKALAISGRNTGLVKSFGEIGLDYDRLHYSTKEDQLHFFEKQLEIAAEVQLPLFLHMRAANDDFIEILSKFWDKLPKGGVVHSFTGTLEELQKLLDMGLYIGLNGCSLKTEENLTVAKAVPLDRIMIETDAPWCEIRKTHAGYKYLTPYPNETYPLILTRQSSSVDVNTLQQHQKNPVKMDDMLPFPLLKKEQYNSKYDPTNSKLVGEYASPLIKSRNEPVHIGQVAEILSKIKGVSVLELVNAAWANSIKLFEINEHQEEDLENLDEYFEY